MPTTSLYQAVAKLASVTVPLSEANLGQPWQWYAHKEGIRFALIGDDRPAAHTWRRPQHRQ